MTLVGKWETRCFKSHYSYSPYPFSCFRKRHYFLGVLIGSSSLFWTIVRGMSTVSSFISSEGILRILLQSLIMKKQFIVSA